MYVSSAEKQKSTIKQNTVKQNMTRQKRAGYDKIDGVEYHKREYYEI